MLQKELVQDICSGLHYAAILDRELLLWILHAFGENTPIHIRASQEITIEERELFEMHNILRMVKITYRLRLNVSAVDSTHSPFCHRSDFKEAF